MNQQTLSRAYKKVMWYHRGVGYGNDLTCRRIQPWDEKSMEAYATFVRPLMPGKEVLGVGNKSCNSGSINTG